VSFQKHAKCEVHAVIRFLHAKKETAVEIYQIYGEDVMTRQNVAKLCREFEAEKNDVHVMK
jgi:hypothetical protein